MSTGQAATAYTPNTAEDTTTDFGGGPVRGNTDLDVTIWKVDVDVPPMANCLLGVDFRFLSEEYPEWVGTEYNDAFIAEVDQSTWTTNGSEITAPGNFAFDEEGNPISINAAGAATMTAANAAGTTYDGGSTLLSAAAPLTPGPHSLYFSIFDQGDTLWDSTVLLDNIRIGRVADPADCRPGARAVVTLTTAASPGVVVGGQVSDTATLAGGASPTGTITFTLYGPDDTTCTGTPVFISTVPVSGNGDYPSGPFTTTAPGTYRWIAAFSGDANNTAVTGACNDPGTTVEVTSAGQLPVTGTDVRFLASLAAGLLALGCLLAIVTRGSFRLRQTSRDAC